MHITVDYSERGIERRLKILEGAKWDLFLAKRMLFWVTVGFTPEEIPTLITPEVKQCSPSETASSPP